MIILSVDYGDVRTGIAVCDKNEMLASPVTVITERNAEILADKISVMAKEQRAQKIVMGLPKNMDGTLGFRAQAVTEFQGLLEQKTGLPVCLWDERLTTVCAHTYLNMTNTRGAKRKQTVDAVSAVIILEDYISYQKSHRQVLPNQEG